MANCFTGWIWCRVYFCRPRPRFATLVVGKTHPAAFLLQFLISFVICGWQRAGVIGSHVSSLLFRGSAGCTNLHLCRGRKWETLSTLTRQRPNCSNYGRAQGSTCEWIGTILIRITRVMHLPPFIFPNGIVKGVSGYDFRLHTTKQQQNTRKLQLQKNIYILFSQSGKKMSHF